MKSTSSVILQLSDLHLMADPDAVLKGVKTRDTFVEVLNLARERSLQGGNEFDFVVLSGDLAHDEQLVTYEILREQLGDWLPRCRLIPGNHDDRASIRKVFPELVPADGEFITFSVESAGWRLIGLDSHLDGEVHGHVDPSQLDWLAAELSTHASQPTLVFVHHPPVLVQSPWLDAIGLVNSTDLMDVIRSFKQVRVICTGHVHQESSTVLDDVQILTTPSTGVQFLPYQDELVCDTIPPGFRLIRLDGDKFETSVVRLSR